MNIRTLFLYHRNYQSIIPYNCCSNGQKKHNGICASNATKMLFLFFISAMVTFWLAFGFIGQHISNIFSKLFNWWQPSGLLGALWDVVTMLLGLVPQLIILFTFFYLVERKSPPALLRIIMGFGCGTVAASTLSTINEKPKRTRTAVLLSFIPCSAQAPVILLIAGILGLNFFVIFLLYITPVIVGIVVSWLMSKKNKNVMQPQFYNCVQDKQKPPQFSFNEMFKSVLGNTFQFFHRISGTVLVAAGFLYFLSAYNFHFQHTSIDQSIMYYICDLATPLFIPLGFTASIIAVLVFGILGKEMAAAAILMLSPFNTTVSAVTFVIFFMIYPPCIANIKSIANQTSNRTVWFIIALNFTTAYIASFIFCMFAIAMGY